VALQEGRGLGPRIPGSGGVMEHRRRIVEGVARALVDVHLGAWVI
jgi:hypothetical protein